MSPRGVSEWTGEWEDAGGNAVTYHVHDYQYRDVTHDRVRWSAEYFTAASIELAKKTLPGRR